MLAGGLRPGLAALLCLALLPSPAWADDLGLLCGGVKKAAAAAPADTTLQQKKHYCDAARSSQESAKANSTLWKVWAAVAGVCTAACVSSVAGGPTQEYVCLGVTLAGGATDAIVTREFTTALMTLGGAGVSFAINRAGRPSAPAETPGRAPAKAGDKAAQASAEGGQKKSKDVGACLSAATAGLQTFLKVASMNSAEKSVKTNLDEVRKLRSPAQAAVQGAAIRVPGQEQEDAAFAGGGSQGGSTGTTVAPDEEVSSDPCSSTGASPYAVAGQIGCAVASDSNLPPFVSGPRFSQDFQRETGQSLGDFLGRDESPKQALTTSMGSSLNSSQLPKLVAALDQAESGLAMGGLDSAVYQGGGGGGSGGGGTDPGIGDMVAGLMGQLAPKKGEGPSRAGENVAFANRRYARNPAAVAEDPTLNIFDRISYRYWFVEKSISSAPGGVK